MLRAILHKVVAVPFVYDLVQTFFGSTYNRNRYRKTFKPYVGPDTLVVDIGGGTGLNRTLLPGSVRYICLDNDMVKLKGFVGKQVDGTPILGDGAGLPLKSASVDLAICSSVLHHIPEEYLGSFVQEVMRLIKPGGAFIFLDALWVPQRMLSGLMWRYDRGAYPRTEEVLRELFASHGRIVHWERWSLYHVYVVGAIEPHP